MKKLLFIILLTSFSIFSQSKEDYKKTVDFVVKAYNEQKPSLIYQKFDQNLKSKFTEEVFKIKIEGIFSEKGQVYHCEFVKEDNEGKSYLTEYEGGLSMILFLLSPEGKIVKFALKAN